MLVFEDACVAVCGPSVLDLLVADSSLSQVTLRRPDSPLLLAGLMAVVAGEQSVGFALDFTEGGNVAVSSHGLSSANAVPVFAREVRIRLQEPASPVLLAVCEPVNGIDVDLETWDRLAALEARTHVPASESSGSTGAGAGAIDND